MDSINNGKQIINVDFRCAHGQHRSVVCSEVVAHLGRSMGFVVVVEHLTARLCGCPHRCDRGVSDDEAPGYAADGVAAYGVARRIWDEM